jgi:hypothetical protein
MNQPRSNIVASEAKPRGMRGRAAFALLGALALPGPALARDEVPYAASAGVELAVSAALSWAKDATLIYLENDEPVDAHGGAVRWGYLFYSATLDKSRGYSIREGRIIVAEDLPMKFEAPPLTPGWIDSGMALEAAERGPGGKFRRDHGGEVRTMLLMRGAFQDKDPDPTTWTLIYTAANVPSLFVVVDAADGKVRRTWRG